MMKKFMPISVAICAILVSFAAYSTVNDTSVPPSQGAADIKVNIQGDTHHPYQGEIRSSGIQSDDSSVMSDQQILSATQDLIQNQFSRYDVTIKVDQGTVVLNGFVPDEQTKQKIESEVRNIPGVSNVTNMLTVQSKADF